MSNILFWGSIIFIVLSVVSCSVYIFWCGFKIAEDDYENGGHR